MLQLAHAITVRGPAGAVTLRGLYDEDDWRVTLKEQVDVAAGHELEINGQRFVIAHVERWPDRVVLKLGASHAGPAVSP